MHLRARRYHKSNSALLCLSFFCVTLLREALVYFKQFTPLSVFTRFQGYTVFKFYPLSLRYRDPAASPLNARQYKYTSASRKRVTQEKLEHKSPLCICDTVQLNTLFKI